MTPADPTATRRRKGNTMHNAALRAWLFRWSITKMTESLLLAIVWRLPHNVVYWATIRAWANATTGPFGSEDAPAVMVDKVLQRWGDRVGGDRSFQ